MHFLRPEIILFSPLLRKLVNESNGVFLSVQNLKSFSSGDIRPELIKHSKQYRSILRACVENLQEILPKEPLSEEKNNVRKFSNYILSSRMHLALDRNSLCRCCTR